MKRTPLKRGKPLARAKRLSPRSVKREAEAAERFIIRGFVFARDGHRCLLAGREAGPLTHSRCSEPSVHHLRKSAQGGEYQPWNLVTLCTWANGAIEDHPDEAWRIGLVCRRGETLPECYERMAVAGLTPPAPCTVTITSAGPPDLRAG